MFLQDFLHDFDYSAEDTAYFLSCYEKCKDRPDFRALVDGYANERRFVTETLPEMEHISEEVGISPFSGDLLLLMLFAEPLRRFYREAGIGDEVWRETMFDLKYKNEECKCVKGIPGTFVAGWFYGFFALARFGFGRLQFETCAWNEEDVTVDGVTVKKGDTVINVHIPRTGTRLSREAIDDAYAKAAAFYRARGEQPKDGPVIFICFSWLLSPAHKEMLPPSSNILGFASDYVHVRTLVYDTYYEVWRLFDCHYDGNPDHLPADSTLRRAYIDLIRRGEKTTEALGVYVYRK